MTDHELAIKSPVDCLWKPRTVQLTYREKVNRATNTINHQPPINCWAILKKKVPRLWQIIGWTIVVRKDQCKASPIAKPKVASEKYECYGISVP